MTSDPYNIIEQANRAIDTCASTEVVDGMFINSPSHRATAHLTDEQMDEINSNYDPGYRVSDGAIGGGGKPNGKRVW